ncbi:septum site-determining protein MinC [Cuneatibacter caecimuris]|uniref:Probable septum site-determining protein MinC n=1 Tax=Cuneatibacter caecimuris TaxID=1796618 RepID=A0A4Q7NZL9_9FIRM|nr:septum site-determining protein MinC [Cuneatibacter caecimuris]RZS92936.1 septum site-determining protein MinC [Cuneatibacter caecimuris]
MNQLVSIKGNRYGIAVRMDASAPFEKILEDAGRAFSEAADFFRDARMAVSFQGRELTPDQEGQLLDVISAHSRIQVVCVVDEDKARENLYQKAVEQYARSATTPPRVAEQEPLEQEEDSLPGNEELYRMDEQSASAANPGQFYKGTLRSGQVVESDSSIIVLGDINPGATVIAKGNVVVLGSLKGNAHAGSNGNTTAFVVALEMQPMQIRIGDVMGRCADGVSKRGTKPTGPQIAFVENENIYVESISRDIMNEINFQ